MSRYVSNATFTPSRALRTARQNVVFSQRTNAYQRTVVANRGVPPPGSPGKLRGLGRNSAMGDIGTDAAVGLTMLGIEEGMEALGMGSTEERARAQLERGEAELAARQALANNLEQAEARKAGSDEHWLDEQREARDRYEEEVRNCGNENCRRRAHEKYQRTKWGTRLPSSGTWDGEPGNSKWRPTPGSQAANAVGEYGQDGVNYRRGHPDFSPFQHRTGGVMGVGQRRSVVDVHNLTGTDSDFSRANRAMGDGFNFRTDAPGYTWHHNKNGVTLELVDSRIHNTVFQRRPTGGAVHTGGASYLRLQQTNPARF